MSESMDDARLESGPNMTLNQANIEEVLRAYLSSVNSITLPAPSGNVIASLYALKQERLGSGPYPRVSLFEASNRILSDITILLGVRRLLVDPVIGSVKLPFDVQTVALGVQGGNDLKASAGKRRLAGEAFNVAPSFFQSKKHSTLKKLKAQEVDYRLIVFNEDAVKRPEYYIAQSKPAMLYLPVDVRSWAS